MTNPLEKYSIAGFKELSKSDQDQWVEEVFQHYRKVGFPYYKYNQDIFDQNIKRIRRDRVEELPGNILKPKQTPTIILSYFMPHLFESNAAGRESATEFWKSDTNLYKLVRNRFKHAEKISDATFRRGLRILCKLPTNFNPSLMRHLCEKYGPKKDGIIYDFCAGWGGRLIGANFAKNIAKYIGLDPSTKTYQGLNKIKQWLEEEYLNLIEFELHQQCAEDFQLEEECDLIITSPPYFTKEIYSTEVTQSHLKFPEYQLWFEQFLLKSIEHAWSKLKVGGKMLLSVSDSEHCQIYSDLKKQLSYPLVIDWRVQYTQIYTDKFFEHVLVYQKT